MEKDDEIPELFNVKLNALSEFNDFLKNEAVKLRNKKPLLFKDKFMMKKNLKFLKNNHDDLLERTNSDLLSFSMSQQTGKNKEKSNKRSKSQNNIKIKNEEDESEEERYSITSKEQKKQEDPDSPSFLAHSKKTFTASPTNIFNSFDKENINNMNSSLYNASNSILVHSNNMKTINTRFIQNNGMNPNISQNNENMNYDKNNGICFNNDIKSAAKNSKMFSESKYKDDLSSTMAPKSDLKSEFSSSFKNNHNYNWFYDKKINGLYEELKNMENELNLKSADILKLKQEKEEACEKIKKKSKTQLKEKNKQIKELNEKIIEYEEIIANNNNKNNAKDINDDELVKMKDKNLELEKYVKYLEHKNSETVKKFEEVKKNLGNILSSYSKKLEELSEQELNYSRVIQENSKLKKEKDELKKRLSEINKKEKNF